MEGNDEEDEGWRLIPLPPSSTIRDSIAQHLAFVRGGLGATFFLGISIAFAIGVWFSGGDMFIVVPALIVGFGFAAVGWLLVPDFSKTTRIIWIILSAIGFGTLGLGIYHHFQNSEERHSGPLALVTEKEPKDFGVLKAKSTTLISGTRVFRRLEIGTSGTIFNFTGPAGRPLLKIFQNSELTLEVIDGHLEVSTKFSDKHGHTIAQLIRNEWKVAPAPEVWDRNYSKDALEVKGPDGNIVFQVRVLPDRIQMSGIWYGPDSSFFAISNQPSGKGKGGMFTIRPPHGNPAVVPPVLTPMFRYPSELHLGEFAAD